MPGLHLDQIVLPRPFAADLRFRLWREWCFVRAAVRHLRWRVLIIFLVIVGGGLLFQRFEPEKNLSLAEAAYYTWALVFGEAPEAFPRSTVLRVLFFLVPVLGLTVIIEAIVDVALLMRDRRRYERNWCLTMAQSMNNHIILVGFGRLGYRAFRLLRRLGERVVVIERDPNNRFLEPLRREGSPLLVGDARDESLLIDANVAEARSVVVATNDDLANLEIALDARRLRPGIRVVVRMFDQNMADKIRDGFNIHIAMSQSALAAPAFAMAALDATIINSFVVGERLVVMMRWTVREGGPLAGLTAGQVTRQMHCGVVEVRREGFDPVLFPPDDALLLPGDELIVQGPFEKLADLTAQVRAAFHGAVA